MLKILIAEDEKDLSRVLSMALAHEGYDVTVANDGKEAIDYASHNLYHCMIFDIMMPNMNGLEALQFLRDSGDNTPVIFLTAKTQVDDRVDGLDAGADDYLTKPFSIKELLARVRSLCRRNDKCKSRELSLGSVSLNTEILELSGNSSIRLSQKEAELMEHFMRNPDKSISSHDLFIRIWDESEEISSEIVWVYICYLKEKLKAIRADIEILGDKGGEYTLSLKKERSSSHDSQITV